MQAGRDARALEWPDSAICRHRLSDLTVPLQQTAIRGIIRDFVALLPLIF